MPHLTCPTCGLPSPTSKGCPRCDGHTLSLAGTADDVRRWSISSLRLRARRDQQDHADRRATG